MMDLDFYTQLPFKARGRDESGVDCWGLVALFYKREFGVILETYQGIDPTSQFTVAKLIEIGRELWEPVDTPRTGDVVTMVSRGLRSLVSHLGVIVPLSRSVTGVLHTERSTGTIIQPLDHHYLSQRVREIRRYRHDN